ncbi:MAG: CHAT domain-containing protein [Actinomycetota bacterium]
MTTTSRTITLALSAGALFLGSLFIVPGASAQVTGSCEVTIEGRSVEEVADWTDAVAVDAEGTVTLRGRSSNPVSFVKVELEFAGLRREISPSQSAARGGDWAAVLPVSDHADEGVGLYHLVASTDDCTAEGWIKVVGRSPFSTLVGQIATGVLALGLVLQVIGLIGAGRRRGRALAIIGGIPTGLGALVLSQQFGVIPITWGWASAWAVGPGALGGVAHAAVGALRRPPALPERSAVEAPPAGAEPPSAGVEPPTAEPPMTEAEPPVAEAPPPPRAEPVTAEAPPPPVEAPPPTAEAPVPTRAEPRFRGMEPVTRGAEIPHGATFPTGATRGMRPPAERDPPRSAYALLDCPGVVVAEEEFELSAGISEKPTPGVTGGQITRPPTSVGPYVLSVQVVADGFRLAEGAGSWRRDLQVTADAPYPTFVLRLAAEPQIERIKPRAIQAMYSVDGQTIGMAVRSVAVVRSQDLVGRAEEVPQEGGVDIAIPSGETAPDLTVRIVHSRTEGGGRLLWTFESPHRLPSSDAPVVADIGLQPEAFAKRLVEQIAAHEGQPGLYQYLMGIGNTVSDQVPEEFWEVLRAIAEQIGGRSPSLLVLSEEPYVPWELAVMDPPLDPSLPPFLSAQVSVGRWVLGQRRPKLPPPTDVQVDALAVVWGVYDRQEWRLVEAEAEAASLTDKFGALSVDAQAALVIECLKGNPKAELLHFAVHGIYNPTGPKEGLILVDGQTLDPLEVRGVKFQTAPFVFLNACQVGTGTAVLGDYAGMAEAFLYAGAAGVIAPLWSIDDALAREIALRFYQETLVEGRPPAEVFREERARFIDSPDLVSSTFLAYQFFGNPAMKLSRARAPG